MGSGQLRARPSVQETLPEPVRVNDSVVPCLPPIITPHCGSAAADLLGSTMLSLADNLPFQRLFGHSVEAVSDQASQWDRGILEHGRAANTTMITHYKVAI
ncbi:hypothetical protein An02g02120 [Aspergillus niger]|uniref:Uncharacterized protein n=2 Tax=Aspergillus niger TaxID=5061 RepID=A2QC33_ASPNC|nr:hypothetical protein An02g02120 [Aspergillus niger]CAK37514.1 hypothetical protein An02g02120 [Aspergillus niger]